MTTNEAEHSATKFYGLPFEGNESVYERREFCDVCVDQWSMLDAGG